ncbi:MAG: MltA domain-containing protein [Proteobacteria bacterium]|nr:MltA domain-containing protein [Pseudomonadota bacterium]
MLPLAAAVLVSVVASCGGRLVPEVDTPEPQETFLRLDVTTFSEVPGWKGDNFSQALPVFLRSCEKIKALPPDSGLGPRGVMGRVSDWIKICASAALIRPGNETESRYFFESRFTPYLALNNIKTQGLFTGYYEPELRGAWKPNTTYRYPS